MRLNKFGGIRPPPLNFRFEHVADLTSFAVRKLSLRGSPQPTLIVPSARDGILLNTNELGGKGQLQVITKGDTRICIKLELTVTGLSKWVTVGSKEDWGVGIQLWLWD